ncbi:MAG: orotidine-5'-phosphate decarboxylase [Saprospiraceae bacterium]|nr:orotidine-5'-phosphate decarboxylase [Saprospiraceae bacterium]
MHKNQPFLSEQIQRKKSFLCVGLDPDLEKIPDEYLNKEEPLLSFCKDVIDCTKHIAIAYKINIAFFEALGPNGWSQLEKLSKEIPEDCLFIADAKRADIGNTSKKYAEYFYDRLGADALTLHPYMGVDSLLPFLVRKDKWSIVLALTSNPGASDFELQKSDQGEYFFEMVVKKFNSQELQEHVMFVVGATQSSYIEKIRLLAPNSFLLIPGVGEQGGSLEDTVKAGRNQTEGLIINVGRKIMYPKGKITKPDDIIASADEFHSQMKVYF